MSLESTIKALVKSALLEVMDELREQAKQPTTGYHASKPPAPSAPQSPPPAAESAAPEALTYEPIGALIKTLATTKRKEVLEILGEFGAKKGGELKQADWAEAYKKLKALEAGK